MKHHLFSRFTSVLLAVVLLAGLMGTPILATDNVLGAEPAATVEEQTAGSADESASGVDSAAAEQAEETTTDEEESASSDSSTDTETSGEEVVDDEETDSTVPAGDDSDSTVTSEEESTDSAEGTEPADETEAVDETEPTDKTEPAEEAASELTTSVLDENGTTVANVTVEAAEGVIPEGVALVAELLTGEAEEEAVAELNEAGVEYDGFMALDIHLENDNGEEVKPNGEVRVVMVAPAALPEEADPTTVAVQHHEELDNGEVKVEQVASAADAAQPASVALFAANSVSDQPAAGVTADNGAVTAEFAVESFSTFTITWQGPFGQRAINVFYVDSTYNENAFSVPEAPEGEIKAENVNLNEYISAATGAGYNVIDIVRVHQGWNDVEYTKKITDIQCVEKGYLSKYYVLQYTTDNKNWDNFSDGDKLYIVCAEPLDTVDTVNPAGVNISLFDYDTADINKVNGSVYEEWGKEYYDGLLFVNTDEETTTGYQGSTTELWNSWRSGGGVVQEIVKSTLQNGYPVFNHKANVKNLSYLFSPDSEYIVQAYTNLDGLFLKSTYDETGYYEYDAAKNFASLKEDETGFDVYETSYKPNDTALSTPRFLPLNDLVDANTLDGAINYHFGMTIDFNFIQPKDGEVTHNESTSPMVFEFTGDDDVWLFIDDVLVLDMGGIHDAKTGTVNFATGEVTIKQVYENGQSIDKTEKLYDIMKSAGKDDAWLAANFEQNDQGQMVFKDYTGHSFKYYYLERGAGGSNCRIKFNLQTVPAGTLDIAKDVTFANTADASDIGFQFNAYINTDPNVSSDFVLYTGSYDVYELDDNTLVEKNKTANDGIITLKDGQYARLNDPNSIKANSRYYVVEIDATSDKYDVKVNETDVTYVDETGKECSGEAIDEVYGVKSATFEVNKVTRVIFYNSVVTENQYNLLITKEMATGQTDLEQTFQMRVTIGGQLYNGNYTITGADTGYKATNGIVNLKAGQTATITDLMGGNSIKVEEVGLPQSLYGNPTYEIEGDIKDSTDVTDKGYAFAVAKEGKELSDTPQVTVTVTNTRITGDLVIKKTIENNANLDDEAITAIKSDLSFTIVGPDSYSNTVRADEIRWSQDGTLVGTVTLKNLQAGEYEVTENIDDTPVSGAICTVEVKGNGVTGNGKTGTGIVEAGHVLTFEFTNTYTPATGTLAITKQLANDITKMGNGRDVFSFEIKALDGDDQGKVWYMHVDGDGTAILDRETKTLELKAGKYQITELSNINYTCTRIEAPENKIATPANITDRTITVYVGNNEITEVKYTNAYVDKGLTDGSGVINKFKKDGDSITFEKVKLAGDSDELSKDFVLNNGNQ